MELHNIIIVIVVLISGLHEFVITFICFDECTWFLHPISIQAHGDKQIHKNIDISVGCASRQPSLLSYSGHTDMRTCERVIGRARSTPSRALVIHCQSWCYHRFISSTLVSQMLLKYCSRAVMIMTHWYIWKARARPKLGIVTMRLIPALH